MNNTRLAKSLLCVMLVLLMLASAVSCDKGNQPADPTQSGATATSPAGNNPGGNSGNSGNELTEEELYKPERKDYDRDLNIWVNQNGGDINFYFCEAEAYTGSIVNDALYRRELFMEENFGVSVEMKVESDKIYDKLSVPLSAGEYVCDAAMLTGVESFKLAQNGLLKDLALLEELNLSASYWDQRIQSEYAIGDRIFMLEGDYTIYDEMRTYVVLYNDTLYSKYDYYTTYGTPYEMVESETWTLEKMLEMANGMYVDNNTNQIPDEADTYGIVGELTLPFYAFLGSGMKTIANNNGKMTLLIKDSTMYQLIYDTFEDTMQIALDEDILMPQLLTVEDYWTAASNVFEYGRALFRTTSLSAALRLGNMESIFCILPIPAYTENQGGYYCWVSGNNHSPITIPHTVADAHETAEILEAFCYYSKYMANGSLYDAFFEEFRLAKLCRTPEDVAMLNLVFDSKTFDFDQTTKITGIESALYSMAKQGDLTTLSSTLSGLRESAQAKLNEFLLKMS